MTTDAVAVTTNPTPKPPPTRTDKAVAYITEAIAVLFWTYVFFQTFVFDIDSYLADRLFPNYKYLLPFKFVFIVSGIAILLVTVKGKRLRWAFAEIAFYPLIFLFLRLPFAILQQKSWVLAFAFANSVISFFQSFKINFVTLGMVLAALSIARFSSRPLLLWLSITALLIALAVLYVRRFILVFKPARVFDAYQRLFPRLRAFMPKMFELDGEIKGMAFDSLNKEQLQKWSGQLQAIVLYNRSCLFVARKLRDYQSSKLNFVSYVFSLVFLTVITIGVFAGINLALEPVRISVCGAYHEECPCPADQKP